MATIAKIGKTVYGTGLLDLTRLIPLASCCLFRLASKKASPSGTKPGNHGRPGCHGWKKQHNHYVTFGTTLAHQFDLRYCPGLNVGLGKRGQLYAKVAGRVKVTCEKTDFDKSNVWVKKWYPDRESVMYKKYYNVIPDPEPLNFKLIDKI